MSSEELSKEVVNQVYSVLEAIKGSGRIRKGTNEATKSLERNEAKFVVAAKDTTPQEIIMHLPILAKDNNIPFVFVPSKEELGAAVGLPVGTSAVAVADFGDAGKQFKELITNIQTLEKPKESKPEPKMEKPKEEKKPETPKEKPAKPEVPKEEKKEQPAKKEEKPAKPVTEMKTVEDKAKEIIKKNAE